MVAQGAQLSEVQSLLQSKNCECKDLEEKIGQLEYRLREETNVCSCVKQEFENLKENHYSDLRIKEKIIEEQNRTITKQKKVAFFLLHTSFLFKEYNKLSRCL